MVLFSFWGLSEIPCTGQVQSWGLLYLQTLFLSDQKFLSASLSSPKQPPTTKTSSRSTSKKTTGKKSSPPKRFQASKTFVSVFSSAGGDAGSPHLLSRMPMLSHQGGSVVEEQFFDLFIMKKIPMPQLQVIEKLYYWSTTGFIHSVHVTVTEPYTSIFFTEIVFP